MENSSKKVAFRMSAGVLVAITIIVAIFASGVTFPGLENNPSLGSKTGRLTVLLMDAPVQLKELKITINDLEVHRVGEGEGEWINLIYDDGIEFNLLEYQNGNTLNLADEEIDVGTYNKIRIYVSEAEAVYSDDKTVTLRVPPGKIDVITEFELFEGGSKVVLIDMEPDWVAISNSGNLRPVLKATISEGIPPIADFTYSPEEPTTDDEITFTSLSTEGDGTISTYNWNFGDGTEIATEEPTITHTYENDGGYTVMLTVTDDIGLSDTTTQPITISIPT